MPNNFQKSGICPDVFQESKQIWRHHKAKQSKTNHKNLTILSGVEMFLLETADESKVN